MSNYGIMNYFRNQPMEEISNLDFSYILDITYVKDNGSKRYPLEDGYELKYIACNYQDFYGGGEINTRIVVRNNEIYWNEIPVSICLIVYMESVK
ncbi:hypothetical protein RHO12_06490 [Orbus sturtevantii]|uniref:hypothetical protein n=1 Tax=Orbus sturtevantii TaxID=3074109 RepID=UPI00370D88B2